MQARGGFRVRSDGQPVVQSKATAARNGIQYTGGSNEAPSEVAAPDQSGSSSPIPSVSLPKGGGAIRGIGEKFAANPVTGTGSLNVPIVTTSGRSGFGPQLSLSYDSGSGNGPFGFGWSLSLPSITRKTDKGLPMYQDAGESDVFILSGAEDLVPILVNQNGQWQREQQPDRTLPDGSTFTIHCYRPRIEGLFARIERWTDNKTGDIHWQSISRDNITTIYGKTANSRIADPTDKSRIFSWLICESYDDKGNAIFYEYEEEDSANVDTSQVSEKSRNDRSANRYLKYIHYGNQTPRQPGEDLSQRTDWLFEVVFDYGEHDPDAPTTQKILTWCTRQDAFSTYRAGFEVRTYRLCQRVLMFHHFPDKLGTDDCLVRSTEFTYDESSIASFITKITQSGYVRRTDGTYLKKSLPPLEFEYSKATIQEEITEIDAASLENLPIGLDGMSYRWVDLDGEGLSGILAEQANAWFYKPNQGGGKFGPLQLLAEKPSLANLNSGRQQFMDLAGDGQLDLVELSGNVPGFYERTQDQHWKQFTPFASLPNLDWNDPNLKFLDLTGDGHADILITEDGVVTWYLSLAEEGFSMGEKVRQALDEETGPRLVFADGTQSIYLSDLSGDGLTDLVRIRNGEVCYWPNLGYGRFGTKVTMDDAPWFDHPDQFNQQRIRLADIDGSGTTDIIYLGSNGVQIYLNQSGNRWSDGRTLTQFPRVDNLSSVMVADLKGNGTACLIWSSPLPRNARQQMRYIDLMGGQKPHLLVAVKNNMGAETRVHYAPSTKFYLVDKKAGKPWITRIPFPVHVIERVEVYDRISRNRFVTRYAYHHGYFDGIEREFRGFGMVEQWDTEEIGTVGSDVTGSEDINWDAASFVPPVLTKTWFHTGAYFEEGRISKQFEEEYYHEGDPSLDEGELTGEEFQAMLLSDTVLPDNLTAEEAREACRSLKGGILRQEIYALDRRPDGTLTEESDRPYTVSERNYTIKRLQSREDNKHAVFFVHPCETIDFHYERKLVDVGGDKLADPRVSHQMTLEVDKFGNVERSVAIGYPRRDILGRKPEQEETHITLTVNSFINSPELPIKFPQLYSPEYQDWYRVGMPVETQNYEIVNPPEPAVTATSVALFKFEDIRTLTKDLFRLNQDEPDTSQPHPSQTHPYEKWNWRKDTDTPSETKLRLIERVRTLYRKNDLTGFLPMGAVESLALPGETYKLAFTPGLLTSVYQRERGQDTEELLPNPSAVLGSKDPDGGGYVDLDGNGNWWIPSGQVFYWRNIADDPVQELDFARKHFFLPHRFCDPFGKNTVVAYDSSETDPRRNYNILLTETCDPLDNTTLAQNDYRVLQPELVTDPNGVVSETLFDALGLVVATAVHKGGVGDSLQNVRADLTQEQVDDFFADPQGQAVAWLGTATTRIVYDVDRYYRTSNPDKPPYAATIARETHVSDPVPADGLKVQISFSYSDGFGREIQKKIQAEPGPVDDAHTDPRWVGSGWTIFNNKGKPVKQYEPFFSTNHQFEFAKTVGVSSTLFYDPLERVVATLHPNHTYEKVGFDPWRQETWDVNDTVLQADPKNDPDAGDFFSRLQDADYLPTWYERRKNGELGAEEQKASEKAAAHADTPALAYFDTMGRTFLTIADNGAKGKYATQIELDIEGNQRSVIDARGRTVMRYDYDMLGSRIHHASMEAGERWMLNDVAGNPIRAWDSRGHNFWTEYDELRRPLRQFVRGTDDKNSDPRTLNTNVLFEMIEYGEDQENDIELNLRTRVFRQYDSAGIVTNMDHNPVNDKDEAYDFKGNMLRSTRKLAHDYSEIVNWSNAVQTDETFTSSTTYDALNRPIQMIAPHRTGTEFSVIQPVYNEANLLEREDVWLEKDIETEGLLDPDTANHHAVKNIDYNEKGQRVLIQYGNGAETRYSYDPKTFRLIHLYTRRDATFDEDCGDEPPPPCFPAPEKPPKGKQCGLQNIHYTYDPVGNIIVIRDDAQQTIYFNGEVVRPDADYTYDAVYRLIKAHGREHIGQASVPQTTRNDLGRVTLAHPHDGQKMRNYSEIYEYDEVGNFSEFNHYANSGDWVRTYDYIEESLIETGKDSNRLSSTTVRGATAHYTYDEHGNMTRMPHFAKYDVPDQYNMYWDFEDQLQMVDKGGGCKAYYVYDAAGQRVRKVIEQDGVKQKERIYLGGFEVYREYNTNSTLTLERETLHIMDDKQRIALVETRTGGNDPAPRQLIRYQFGNHLGSASLELDHQAQIISYEEYYPYGSTSYQAMRSQTETPKRYRYTGKERDEESGLYYHGARYYAPWLGRWTSADPLGLKGGFNVYTYAQKNPILFIDPEGTQPRQWIEKSYTGGDLATGSAAGAAAHRKRSRPLQNMLEVRYGSRWGSTEEKLRQDLEIEKLAIVPGWKAGAVKTGSYTVEGPTRQEDIIKAILAADVVVLTGHHWVHHEGEPGEVHPVGSRGVKLNDLLKGKVATNVQLIVATGCYYLADDSLDFFREKFPNAAILGFRGSAPLNSWRFLARFESKIKGKTTAEVVRAWREAVDEYTKLAQEPLRQTRGKPPLSKEQKADIKAARQFAQRKPGYYVPAGFEGKGSPARLRYWDQKKSP
jgi:RHS repeat-associated protein